jgi:putative hydrolase of the HAD superfamily
MYGLVSSDLFSMLVPRVILLDAVGTTIHPAEDVGVTYWQFGNDHGSELSQEAVRLRFHQAFRRADPMDMTSEEIESQRWRAIVAEVFADVGDTEALFLDLWQHYAEPASWRVYGDVAPFLCTVLDRNIRVILASNFDVRLRMIVQGLPELGGINHLAISSEVGWKKGPMFFRKVLQEFGVAAHEAVVIGDDPIADYHIAREAGLTSYLVDRSGTSSELGTVSSLIEVIPKLGLA